MNEEHIVISDQHLNPTPESFWRKLVGNKKLLVVVGALVVAELIWAGYTLTRPVTQVDLSQPGSAPAEEGLGAASLALEGPSLVGVGEQFEVEIILTTPAKTDAADVVINYDPKLLELVPAGASPAQTGSIYSEYPVNLHEAAVGRISVSGAAGVESEFSGEGNFASLTFKAKTAGKTQVTIEFTNGSGSDSNVVDSKSGNDILGEVSNLEITISN